MAEQWDRQPKEPEPAYRAFCTYRDMGPDRTTIDAYRLLTGNTEATHKSGDWNRWAKAHKWRERAMSWDHHQSAVATRAVDRVTEEQAEKWARRRDQQAESDYAFAQNYAGQIARHFPKSNEPPLAIRDLKDAVNVTAAASALAWAAIAAGMPDLDDAIDYDHATTEQLRAILARLEGKIAPRIARTG